MSWIVDALRTSIGKKLLMAITGLGFLGFIFAHLAGNLTIYFGRDAFMAYVTYLHGFEPLIALVEMLLLAVAVVHVTTGFVLFLQNRKARPGRYAVNKSGGGRNIGSATMPYTGFLILLFVILHLKQFHFIDTSQRAIYDIAAGTFSSYLFSLIYIAAVVLVGIHIRHGFWSLFQTLGWNHDKYMPLIRTIGIVFAVAVAVGFGLIPIYMGIAA